MSGPSQRAAERQSARRGSSTRPSSKAPTSHRTGSRSTSSVRSSSTKGASAPPAARAGAAARVAALTRPSLTGRAVVLALTLALLVFTLAVPARALLKQRAEINALRASNAAAQSRVDELTVREERLKDPAYVTSLVRERLHYVLPGEVGYVVLDPAEAPAPGAVRAAAPPAAWYSALWSGVRTADGAASTPVAPVGVPVRPNAPR
jgi:cell division protein FtsB